MTWRELSGSRIATRRTIKSTTIENPGMLYVGSFPCLACRHALKVQMWTVKHSFFSFSSHVRLFLLLDLQTMGMHDMRPWATLAATGRMGLHQAVLRPRPGLGVRAREEMLGAI